MKTIVPADKEEIIRKYEELKPGHWITTRTFLHHSEFYCDNCKCKSPNNEKWAYCPNCGKPMEVDT